MRKTKKVLLGVALVTVMAFQLTGCAFFDKTCKADGCDSKSIYEDGYCKTHYYMNVGENLIDDLFK